MPGEDEVDRRRLLEFLFAQLYRRRTLPEPPPFPAPETADESGCVALGGRLTPEMVLDAYRQGIFPMGEPDETIGWWSPDPRTVVEFETFHVSRRLARTVKQRPFEIKIDEATPDVIAACADRDETWITQDVEEVYGELARQGHVHSVEAWEGTRLVGGLYGVTIGGAFMAESMFHRERDASKLCVVALVERLKARGFALLDIQYRTEATGIFDPIRIPRREYLRRLKAAVELGCTFVD